MKTTKIPTTDCIPLDEFNELQPPTPPKCSTCNYLEIVSTGWIGKAELYVCESEAANKYHDPRQFADIDQADEDGCIHHSQYENVGNGSTR